MASTSNLGSVDLLILAAYAPELVGLRRLLGDPLYGNVSGVVVSCKTVGVGLPNAVAGTVTRLMQLRPRAVVLVGTAGVYWGAGAQIGEVIIPRRVQLVAPSECEGRGAMPEPMGRTVDCNPMLALGLGAGRTPSWELANTLAVTTDDALGARIQQATGCGAENLEAFGVANACALQNVPFACVMGVSNRVGASGRDEWRQHHKNAAQGACEIVSRWLVGGATGLPHA